MISGILSVVYRLLKLEEPTFISLGVDLGVFIKLFQSVNKLPDSLQGNAQYQLETAQVTVSTQQQGASNLHVGDGAVLGQVHQQVHRGEGVVAGAAGALVVTGGTGTAGTSHVAEQDVKMGE